MLTPPSAIVPILQPFSTLFQQRTWLKAQILLVGAILSPRKRTVTSALRVMGLSDDSGFAKYHHVLNRAVFSPLQLSRVLLLLLVSHLAQDDEPLVFGIDETIERRWGRRIKARAIYRDAARSSKSHLVKASGSALDKPDVADHHTLGTSYMGTAGADRTGAVRTLPSQDRQTP